MIRKVYSLLFVFFCVVRVSNGQIPTTLNDFYDNFRKSKYERGSGEKSDIKGSPHENSEFVKGDVFTSLKQHYSGIPLRFNIFSNQMEFLNPEGDINEISPPDIIDSVIIGDSKYIFFPHKAGSKIQKSFFRILTGKEPRLLIKMNVVFKEAEPPGGYKEAVPASFERLQDDFYLTLASGEAVKFSGKKEFLELFPSHQADLEQFIKQNKIRFNRQEEVVRVMEFIYSLDKK